MMGWALSERGSIRRRVSRLQLPSNLLTVYGLLGPRLRRVHTFSLLDGGAPFAIQAYCAPRFAPPRIYLVAYLSTGYPQRRGPLAAPQNRVAVSLYSNHDNVHHRVAAHRGDDTTNAHNPTEMR